MKQSELCKPTGFTSAAALSHNQEESRSCSLLDENERYLPARMVSLDATAIQTFCRQMALIEAGRQEPVIQVGNLEPRRDYTHVDDVARALWALIQVAPGGTVYNMCSGQATRIGDIVEMVVARGLVPAMIYVDPMRLRPVDEPVLRGDNSRLCALTGWQPEITMEQIVDQLLVYWRQRIQDG